MRVPETSICKTPGSQRRRLHAKQCLLSTSEKQAASLHMLKWEYIGWKAWLLFSLCSGKVGKFQTDGGLSRCRQKALPTGKSCTKPSCKITALGDRGPQHQLAVAPSTNSGMNETVYKNCGLDLGPELRPRHTQRLTAPAGCLWYSTHRVFCTRCFPVWVCTCVQV